MNLGKAVKLCRTQKDLSQTELAEAADISVSYLSLLERERRDPSLSTVEKIAAALKVPMIILMFLAADNSELSNIDSQLVEKLSYIALKLSDFPVAIKE